MNDISTNLTSEREYKQKLTAVLAAQVLGFLDNGKYKKSEENRMKSVVSELSERIVNSGPLNGGLQNWAMIASLQRLVNGKALSEKEKRQLKNDLYKLSGTSILNNRSYSSDKKLEERFWKKMR